MRHGPKPPALQQPLVHIEDRALIESVYIIVFFAVATRPGSVVRLTPRAVPCSALELRPIVSAVPHSLQPIHIEH